MAGELRAHYVEALRNISVKDADRRDVVALASSEPLSTCLDILRARDLRAIPILTEESGKQSIAGIVDFIDVLSFIVSTFSLSSSDSADTISQKLSSVEATKAMFETPIFRVANFSKRNPLITCHIEATFYDVAKLLHDGAKRVVVVDESGTNIINVITQADIIKALKLHDDRSPAGSHQRTVAELHLGSHSVVSVSEESRAIDGFMLMNERKLSALPIVDSSNELVSIVSVRDLKCLSESQSCAPLLDNIFDYIALNRSATSAAKTSYPYVGCKSTTTLEAVLKRLEVTRVHRLAVVDDNKRPVGIISAEDVITFIVSDAH